jgi:hypothetical protein
MAKLQPIVVYASEGSYWRSPAAAQWLAFVIVRDENGALISDPETVRILFGPEHAEDKDRG